VEKKRYNDEELIEGLRQGDDKILNFLYKNYYGIVRSMVLKTSGNEDQARDIFQEVIIVIYNKLQNNKFKITSSFFTFFYAVMKNTWLNYRKVSKKNPLGFAYNLNDEISFDKHVDEIELLTTRALRNQLFMAHFKQLTVGCQSILRLFMTDHSAEDIALKLDLKSANYVRKRKSNCLSTLIERIRKDSIFKELI